jgi:hypothetical protein
MLDQRRGEDANKVSEYFSEMKMMKLSIKKIDIDSEVAKMFKE